MKRASSIITGVASLFVDTSLDVFEKYPATYEKDVKKSLQNGWNNVGFAIKGAIEQYAKTEERAK